MNIELHICIFLILVGIGASFVQRVSGFGLGIFAMLFLPHFMPTLTDAVSISCFFSCITSTYNTVKYRKDIPHKTVLPMLIAALIFIPIAVYFSAKVSGNVFTVLLGVILILLSLYFLFFNDKIHFKPTPFKGMLAGAVGGTLNGLFSTGGPPIVLYLTHAIDDNVKYFAGIQFYFCVTNIYATMVRAINGLITLEVLFFAAVGIIGCFLGDYLGRKVFDKLNAKKLKVVIYIGMIVSGILMLI